jgi:hypothetical protein
MTDETLKYYIALQDKFQVAMGPPRIGDRIYDSSYEKIGFISDIFLPADRLDYIADNGNAYWVSHEDFAYLPIPIDPRNPERGLWGMVDWSRFWCEVYSDGHLLIRRRPRNEYDISDFRVKGEPTEALLRALCEQEGV